MRELLICGVILLCVVWFVGAPLTILYLRTRHDRAFKNLASSLGTAAASDCFEVFVAGVPLRVMQASGRSNFRKRLFISVGAPPLQQGGFRSPGIPSAQSPSGLEGLPHLTLRRETHLDRFGKWLRINREVQVGDSDFDRRVYVESSEPDERVKAVLSDPRVRGAVLELVELGMTITCGGGSVVQGVCLPSAGHFEPAWFNRTAEDLARVAAALTALERSTAKTAGVKEGLLALGVLVLVAAPIFGSVSLMSFAKALYRPIDDSFYLPSAVAWLALTAPLLALLIPLMRGKSDSLRNLLMVAIPTSFITAPCLAVSAAILLNGALDDSRGVRYEREVRARTMTQYKGRLSYSVEFDGVPGSDPSLKLYVEHEEFVAMPQGSSIAITLRKGPFGIRYLSDLRPAHSRSAQ